ncbi:MAG: hypothetical protein K1Y01_05170 [Vicinamibacteria bacterium]|nr:hypothetical protein [Vicinamibacteria bacterium]
MNLPTDPDADIRRRARSSYERARAGNALALAGIVAAPAMLLSTGCCPTPTASILCGLALAAAIALARFAGKGSQTALRPGLIAGALAFALPLACHGLMACPNDMCVSPRLRWIPFVAAGAGFGAGIVMRLLFRQGSRVVAGSTALLLGSLGSLVMGLSGPAWTALGLAVGALVPVGPVSRQDA